MREDRVLIVGAGLAGLCCAHRLQEAGVPYLILEAADEPGGRIRTDLVEGFRLDRGFQVLLTSYPEARRVLDYAALQLRPFYPGALIRFQGKFHRLADPWRQPLVGLRSAFNPIGTLFDKLRIARLRARVLRGKPEELFEHPETTTMERLHELGFSPAVIDRFFRPFFGGIFLEAELKTSSRLFEYLFRMFAQGDTTLPAEGMQAIPRQLADGLTPGTLRTEARVTQVEPGQVILDDGEQFIGRAVVVAVEGPAAARLLPDFADPGTKTVRCFYFAAETPPLTQPILVLNGDGIGPVNNLCVPSLVSSSYALAGAHLISATVLECNVDDGTLEQLVRKQMRDWFGANVQSWRLLRVDHIKHALPRQAPPALSPASRSVRVQPGLYVAGDHREQASIQGAMVAGRRAAEAVLEDTHRHEK